MLPMLEPSISVALALAFVLFALGALHVFWGVRNRYGGSVVIPELRGQPAFGPARAQSFAVAAALFAATFIALAQGRVVPALLPRTPLSWAAMAAGSAFLLRAIGEFRLVGFSKRIRGTAFARWDTWCFSPLCVLIGSAFWYLALR